MKIHYSDSQKRALSEAMSHNAIVRDALSVLAKAKEEFHARETVDAMMMNPPNVVKAQNDAVMALAWSELLTEIDKSL